MSLNTPVILHKGLKFYHVDKPDLTYTVESVDIKTNTLYLSYFEQGLFKTAEYYLPAGQKLVNNKTWIIGEGNDKMQIKIHNKEWFCSDKRLNSFLVENRGKWVYVDTEHLFNDQYNVDGFRIYDYHITEIKNDKRKNETTFSQWGDIKPEICIFPHHKPLNKFKNSNYYSINDFLVDDFNLSYNKNCSHYTLTNHRKTNFKFLYRDGVFYVCNGIGYKKTSVSKHVRSDMVKPLTEFFRQYYTESVYTQLTSTGFRPVPLN